MCALRTHNSVQVSSHSASLVLILRTVLGAAPVQALLMWWRVLGGLGEGVLSSLLQGNLSSGCKWSEEEFLHQKTKRPRGRERMERRKDH